MVFLHTGPLTGQCYAIEPKIHLTPSQSRHRTVAVTRRDETLDVPNSRSRHLTNRYLIYSGGCCANQKVFRQL
jgi:hypothetical protein